MSDTIYDPDDTDSIVPRSPLLERVEPNLGPEEHLDLAPKAPRRRRDPQVHSESEVEYCDPEDVPLLENLAPNHTELSRFDPVEYNRAQEGDFEEDCEMTEIAEDPERPGIGGIPASRDDGSTSIKPDNSKSPKTDPSVLATAALNHPAASKPEQHDVGQPSMERNDSAHDDLQQPLEPRKGSPLRVDTTSSLTLKREDSIAASPTLRKHIIPFTEGAAATLPAMQCSPTKDGQAASPQSEKLPSVRQITGHLGDSSLNELAEAATRRDTRPHRHSLSLGSTVSQSPMLPYNPSPAAQNSPSSHYNINAGSPTNAVSEHHFSPPYYPHSAYLHPRRSSTANTPNYPSLPSASSSSDSQTTHTTPMDQVSTSHTTPIDMGSVPDGTPGRTLPPIPGMPVVSGFKCDYPGCHALPFQTQYLLSSHKNVHSQTRNYFCPVEGCKHGEGGKGFKRKNEMNRHALVHKSPGFTCPFCPDREHKYPRPDNLQRHVRVHHVDKGSNDPQLREVLAQRNDGTGKTGRRQRRNTTSPVRRNQ